MKIWKVLRNTLFALTLSFLGTSAFAVDDLAFELDVTVAVDDALQWLRNTSAFTSSGILARRHPPVCSAHSAESCCFTQVSLTHE